MADMCRITATRRGRRIRVTADPDGPYAAALRLMGWQITIRQQETR
jgi:hypothetical protein